MTRTMLSSLAAGIIFAVAASGPVPAEAANLKSNAKSSAQAGAPAGLRGKRKEAKAVTPMFNNNNILMAHPQRPKRRAVSQDFQKRQKNFGTSSSGKSGKSATKDYSKGFVADSFGFGVERE